MSETMNVETLMNGNISNQDEDQASDYDFSDLVKLAGVSDTDVADAVKEYEIRERKEEEAKKNKASLFPRIATVLGTDEAFVSKHVELIDISTSQILQASLFSDEQIARYVGDEKILSDVDLLADEDDYIDNKLDEDNPYNGLDFISKLAVIWNFTHRKIEDGMVASRAATKFKITDEDLEDAANLTDSQKKQISVFAYRLRLNNSLADNHSWKGVFDKNLDLIIDILVSNPVSGNVSNFEHSSLEGRNLDEKLWWFQRASSVDEISTKTEMKTQEIHRSILKVMADMSIKDEDLQWILDNVSIENSADTIVPLMYEVLNAKWIDGEKFSILDYNGTIVNMIYDLCAITINLPAEGGAIPRSVRDDLHKDAMRGLSTLAVAFGGYLPNPATVSSQAMLSMADKKMKANEWGTFSEHFYNAYYDLLEEKPEWEEVIKERAELRQEWLDAGGNEKAYEESISLAKENGLIQEAVKSAEEGVNLDNTEDEDEEDKGILTVAIDSLSAEDDEDLSWELDRTAEERILRLREEPEDEDDLLSDYLDQMFLDAEEEDRWAN